MEIRFWVCALVFAATAAAAQTTQHAHLMVQAGGAWVDAVAFSPDGRRVLTGGWDKIARLWDVQTGKELQSFVGHSGFVTSVAFSSDGTRVLTGSGDQTARLWDVETGKELQRFAGPTYAINSVAFSPDRRKVLTGNDDGTARIWDVQTGKELLTIQEDSSVTSVAFSPDGRSLLTGADVYALLWDAQTGKPVGSFEGNSIMRSVAFSPDGRTVLTGGDDNSAWLWDVKTGKALKRFEGHSREVYAVAFSPDGRWVLTGSGDTTARLWDVEGGKEVRRFEGCTNAIWAVAFSSDGQSVLTGSVDNTARLWDEHTGKELQRFQGHSASVYAVAFSPDGHEILTGSDGARLWDVQTGKELRRLQGRSSTVVSGTPSADENSLLTGSNVGSRTFFADGVPLGSRIVAGTFSADGNRVLTRSGDDYDRLLDAATGKELQRFEGHAVAISRDGQRVLTGSKDKTARLWNVQTGKELQRFEAHSAVDSVALSPDGQRVLTGGDDNTARLWDVQTGKELQHFEGHDSPVDSVAFSEDGRRALTASKDGTARLWEVQTGTELMRFSGHTSWVYSAVFSPDGRSVLTASLDNTARLWDVQTGRALQRFAGHSDSVYSAVFSPDGDRVLTASSDGTARLWDAPSGRELAALVSFTSGGWAVVDPAGHYDASDPDDSSSLYWVTNNLRTIDLGQLKKEYYTPGLLTRVMRGERLPDVNGMDTVALPPVVSVAAGYNPATRQLLIDITNEGGGVGTLLVKVNDRLLRTVQKPGSPTEGKSLTLPVDLSEAPFISGDNTIRVTAYDAANRIESHPVITHYVMSAAAEGTTARGARILVDQTTLSAGRFYAIVVGTSTFGGPEVPNLTFPAKDAQSMAAGIRLGAERLYGKDKVWMRVLTTGFRAGDAKTGDGLPTKQNIRAAFDEVRKTAQPEDTLLVYLSGHGAMSSSNRDLYYYLTMDARTFDIERDPTLKDVSTVSSAELFAWLREPVKTMPLKQVVILDTCAAGGAANDLMKLAEKRDIPPDQRRAIELLKDATGTFILMGSAADSASYEASQYGEGLLTYALLQGMRGESLDDGSRLGVNRWFEKASEEVPDLARSIGGIQKPVIAAPKGTGFPVALLTADDRAKIPLAMAKPQLLKVVCENEDQEDPLDLRALVREQLRALNYAQARGDDSTSGEGNVMYLDATDEDLPGALAPKLKYVQKGDTINVRVKLVAQGRTTPEQTVTGSASDKQALAKKLANTIVALALAAPP